MLVSFRVSAAARPERAEDLGEQPHPAAVCRGTTRSTRLEARLGCESGGYHKAATSELDPTQAGPNSDMNHPFASSIIRIMNNSRNGHLTGLVIDAYLSHKIQKSG